MTDDDNVLRFWILFNLTAILGGDSGRAKKPGELVHAEGSSLDLVRGKLLLPHGSNEPERRYHQRRRTGHLVVAGGRWIIFQEEERIQVENHRVVEVEVRIIPYRVLEN